MTKTIKGYKFRLYPTNEQIEYFNKCFGSVRYIYNWANNRSQEYFKETMTFLQNNPDEKRNKTLSKYDLNKELTQLKNEKEWLNEVNSQALEAAIEDFTLAREKFFKKKGGYPKFKSKHDTVCSFTNRQNVKISIANQTIKIPKLKTLIKGVIHRSFEGEIKIATIRRTPTGKYYASLSVEETIQIPDVPPIKEERTLGLDLGLIDIVVTSDNQRFSNHKTLAKSLSMLKKRQQQLSRSKKGSNRRKQKKLTVAKIHEKIINVRADQHYQVITELVNREGIDSYVVEDLNIKGMVKNKKLARTISDAGWGGLVRKLEYKAKWSGKRVVKCDRFFPSTKTCSSCGNVIKKLKLSVRKWNCPDCRTHHDRDQNAAINIKMYAFENQ